MKTLGIVALSGTLLGLGTFGAGVGGSEGILVVTGLAVVTITLLLIRERTPPCY